MEKLPFTSFDFWGYLASGFLLLCAIDSAAGYGLLARSNWTFVEGILALSVAYVVGHVIAGFSSLILERGLVSKFLGWPSSCLFGASRAPRWVRTALSSYYAKLPTETRKAVLDRAAGDGVLDPGEALFWLAFAKARANDRTMARLTDFLNQYSFCRNVALVSLVDSAILYWAHWQPGGTEQQLLFARIALVVGVALVVRYLKFLRHYSLELFTAFAHADEKARTP